MRLGVVAGREMVDRPMGGITGRSVRCWWLGISDSIQRTINDMCRFIYLVTIFNMTLRAVSTTMTRVSEIITELELRKKSIACNGKAGLLILLEELGFTHRPGKTEGHRLFEHSMLSRQSEFKTHSVDCGHKPNREMKFPYVLSIIRKLKQYKSELESLYEQNNPSS